jgi:hypothetical protein
MKTVDGNYVPTQHELEHIQYLRSEVESAYRKLEDARRELDEYSKRIAS